MRAGDVQTSNDVVKRSMQKTCVLSQKPWHLINLTLIEKIQMNWKTMYVYVDDFYCQNNYFISLKEESFKAGGMFGINFKYSYFFIILELPN